MAAAATTLRLLKPLSSAAAPLLAPLNNPAINRSVAPLLLFSSAAVSRHHRSFCTAASASVSSGEATKAEPIESEKGAKIREFRRKLKIVDIKGGVDEGLDRLGETLVVRGWVRTLRAQSSVTFIEVNDGSCLSNMQCVMSSDADGYDQTGSVISCGGSSGDGGTNSTYPMSGVSVRVLLRLAGDILSMMLLGLILHMILLIILLCLKVKFLSPLRSHTCLYLLDGPSRPSMVRLNQRPNALRRMAPSCVVDGDMRGFSKAMFEGLVDNPDRPPPPSVEPPTIPWSYRRRPFWDWTRESHPDHRGPRVPVQMIRIGMTDRYDSEEEEETEDHHLEAKEEDEYDSGEEEETEDHHLEAKEEDESEEYRTEDAAGTSTVTWERLSSFLCSHLSHYQKYHIPRASVRALSSKWFILLHRRYFVMLPNMTHFSVPPEPVFVPVILNEQLSHIGKEKFPDVPWKVESGVISTGASVWIQGTVVSSQGSKQKVELKVDKLVTVGMSDPSFPIQKKRVSKEFLRTKAHLRCKGAQCFGLCNTQVFKENGFLWLSSPIITASDCEGAGEQFCVTTLFSNPSEAVHSPVNAIPTKQDGSVDWSKGCSFDAKSLDPEWKAGNIVPEKPLPNDILVGWLRGMGYQRANFALFSLYHDFFGKPAFLTVSGQLNAETYATALTDMIEPELAFADLEDDMACATAFLQYVKYVLENCKEDMDFFNTWIEKGIIDRLSDVVEKKVVQLTYTDAVELLLKAKKKFEFPVTWGCDLQSEHERYITEQAFGGCPVIVRDYPKDIKAFYMRQNDDGRTVAAMDMLVPRYSISIYLALSSDSMQSTYATPSNPPLSSKIGELIGGSQREERLAYLEQRLDDLKLNKESYWWYLDLRRYGSVPHAGFGLGFERLVQFATGVDNIRDAIPFPRAPGSADF
ncbi:hypothetical protein SASPL_120976 [Salvia splendens]|uniref:Aminoacyl-tRNA synthetase class II (D/K/N) domain-containing protein n=1 Tax=Salvia splendens TaxID=180675 RepID=A0A8X8XWG8_SALSN|nr:hypothetical protein SASPL_120976 [Salvia splendens]